MQYHDTQYISHIEECTYTNGRLTPPLLQSNIDVCNTMTPSSFHIYDMPRSDGRWTLQQHYILLVKTVNWCRHWQVCRRLSADHLHMCSGFPAKNDEADYPDII